MSELAPESDDASAEKEKPTWIMHAGRRNGQLCDFGHSLFVEMHGHADVLAVELTEDPEGPYWGWLRAGDDEPCIIQPRKVMYDMQFPYGPKAEEERGKGRTLRLNAKEVEPKSL